MGQWPTMDSLDSCRGKTRLHEQMMGAKNGVDDNSELSNHQPIV